MPISFRKLAKRLLAPLLRKKHFDRKGGIYVLANPPEYLKAYYEYCTSILLETTTFPGSGKLYLITVEFAGIISKRDKFVIIQYEHTIVSNEYIQGNNEIVCEINSGKYAGLLQARLLGTLKNYENALGVIEYSYSNVLHIEKSGFGYLYKDKAIYISPVFVEFSPRWMFEEKIHGCVTAFGDTNFGRRAEFLARLKSLKIKIENKSGNYNNYEALFGENSLLVNIHQTDLHSTLEELRVLPALACGLLVVSEESPFQDDLIYQDFIEFARLDEMPFLLEKIAGLSAKELSNKFPRNKLGEIYSQLRENNLKEMNKIRTRISGQ